jgi:predicted nucleic acid-binding protein
VAGLTLDAGALIAYERGDERIREILTVAYARGLVPTIPAIVLAEVWRGDARDARVARLLKTSSIETVAMSGSPVPQAACADVPQEAERSTPA